jgi:trimeric autotransporter adhesin
VAVPAFADRVYETTTTAGTGPITMAGAVLGYFSFAAELANPSIVDYTIVNPITGEVEVGRGTWTTELSRDTVFSSSNADALVDFAAGSKFVFVTVASPTLESFLSNLATGTNSLAVLGTATGDSSVSLGDGAEAAGTFSVALGRYSAANADYSIAISAEISAGGDHSVAVGYGAGTASVDVVAVGYGATGDGDFATVIGSGAVAVIDAVALGAGASAANAQSIAIGRSAQTTANLAVAIGSGAESSGGVAIGAGSVSSDDQTVSFGDTGVSRRLVNVSDGIDPTDAATVGQLPTGTGDVVGPASAVDANVVLFDGTTGKLIKDSGKALTPAGVGLSNVTNDAQTKSAIVPNTAPAAGQILVGNAGGTAFAKVTMSGGATIDSAGVVTISGSGANAALSNLASVAINADLTTGAGTAATLSATAPAAITTAQAGIAANLTASAAVAGSSVAGAAAGADATITAGNAARLTSGNANGGKVVLTGGAGIGTGTAGPVQITRAGTLAAPALIFGTASNGWYDAGLWVYAQAGNARISLTSGIVLSSNSYFAFCDNVNTPSGSVDTAMGRAGVANGITFGGNGAGAGTTISRTELNKRVTGIADATGTAVLTVTIPNAAHSAQLYIELCGSLGAGGAIGANEASATNCYTVTFARTAGVNAVAAISAASGASAAAVAGAATVTCTAAMSAVSGAVGASNTFTVNVTISRSGGSSTNHTCLVYAKLLNANATGVSIS